MASPVEVQYGMTSYGGTNTSGTRAYGSSVVAGNYSVVLVQSLGNPCSTGAVTDSQGNAYSLISHDAANDDVGIWMALIASSGSLTVTYTIPGGGTTTEFAIAAVEVSVSGGTTLAKDTEAEGAGTSTSPSTGNLVTSTDTLMLALINVDLFQTPSAAGGFTQRATAGWPQRPASLITRSAAAGTYTPSWTMTGGTYVWRAAAVALKEVSSSTSVTGATITSGSSVSAPKIDSDVRLTKLFAEALTQNTTADVRLTRLFTEALTQNASADVRLTRLFVEALRETAPEARITQLITELLSKPYPDARVSQVVVEVLGGLAPLPRGTSVWIGDGGGTIWIE